MKASVMHTYGGPEVMQYEDYPDPVPAEGEVLVRVAAASINPVDLMQRAGDTKSYLPIEFPGVGGWDVSGTVVALGYGGVTGFKIGDRVMAWAFHTFAELCAVKAELLARVPDGIDLAEAAALPLAGTTGDSAYFCRERAQGRTDRAGFREQMAQSGAVPSSPRRISVPTSSPASLLSNSKQQPVSVPIRW